MATAAAAAAAAPPSALQASFDDLERQRDLIGSCTRLWKELSDHFDTLDRGLRARSDALRSKLQALDESTQLALDSLHRRETSIDGSVGAAIARADERRDAALRIAAEGEGEGECKGSMDSGLDLGARLKGMCATMDAEGFWDLMAVRKKEAEALKAELAEILSDCVDPPVFVMDAVAAVFPVDKAGGGKGAADFGWACVMLLEALVPVVADPELGNARPLITPAVKERAVEMAEAWKEGLEGRGGVDGAKPPDVHTFLQHVVTFGIVKEEDGEFYRKLVVGSSWRKQMPRLAMSLGLGDSMADIIDELIKKGQQLDAVNFAYEADLVDNYPPVPLLKTYLENSKKAVTSVLECRKKPGHAMHVARRREQSALQAVIKCIEDHNLGSEFPPDELRKRLEQLEKIRIERKRTANAPANKRTRASIGGPMPPAKAGRLTNHAHVPSIASPMSSTYSHMSPVASPLSPNHSHFTPVASPASPNHFQFTHVASPASPNHSHFTPIASPPSSNHSHAPSMASPPSSKHSHVMSMPAPPTYIRSTHTAPFPSPYQAPAIPPYSYERPGVPTSYGSQSLPSSYGSQSPPAMRDPYMYRQEEVSPTHIAFPPYTCPPPVNYQYPVYTGYSSGLPHSYQPVYYR